MGGSNHDFLVKEETNHESNHGSNHGLHQNMTLNPIMDPTMNPIMDLLPFIADAGNQDLHARWIDLHVTKKVPLKRPVT